MKVKLARHQEAAHLAIRNLETNGIKKTLIVSPTGSGKTVIFGAFSKQESDKGKKVLILTDRQPLLSQTGSSFAKMFGLRSSLIQSGKQIETHDISFGHHRVFIGMVDTLNNRLKRPLWLNFFRAFDYVIIDEAHEQRFTKVIEKLQGPTVIGFTATPKFSSNRKFMADVYQQMVVLASEEELIEDGRLVEPVTFAGEVQIRQAETEKIKTDQQAIDFQKKKIPLDHVVRTYKEKCEEYVRRMKEAGNHHWEEHRRSIDENGGLTSIAYGVNSQHVIDIAEAFNKAGVRAGYILSDTKRQSKEERQQAYEDFLENRLTVLVNCQIATKGFSKDDIFLVIKCFVSKSLAKNNQVDGRGSRPLCDGLHFIPTSEGRKQAIAQSPKPFFFVLDLLGNYTIHGRWQDPKDWEETFSGKPPKDGVGVTKDCPKCGGQAPASSSVCPNMMATADGTVEVCGHVFPINAKKSKELRDNYVEVKQRKLGIADLSKKKIHYLAGLGEPYKVAEITKAVRRKGDEHLLTFARLKGYKDPEKWVSMRFRINAIEDLRRKERDNYKRFLIGMFDRVFGGDNYANAKKKIFLQDVSRIDQAPNNGFDLFGRLMSEKFAVSHYVNR